MRARIWLFLWLAGCAGPPATPPAPRPPSAAVEPSDPEAPLAAARAALARGQARLDGGHDPAAGAAEALRICRAQLEGGSTDPRYGSTTASALLLRHAWAERTGADAEVHARAAEAALAEATTTAPDPNDLRRLAQLRISIGDAVAATDDDPTPWFRGAVAESSRALRLDDTDTAARRLRYQARHSWLFWLRQQRTDIEAVRLAAIADCTALMGSTDTPLVWQRRRAELYRMQALRTFFRGEDPRAWFPLALADFDAWLQAHPDDHAIRETAGATRLWFADATQRAAGDSADLLEQAAADLRAVVDATSGAWAWWQLGRVRQHQARNAVAAGRDPRPWCVAANGCLDAWAVIEPADPDLHFTRAYVARIAGDTHEALRHYERWLGVVQGRAWRQRWVRGWMKGARAGRAGFAAEWLQEWDLAWWQNDVGRYDRARPRFERGLRLAAGAHVLDDPDYAELLSTVRYDLACCLAVLSTGRVNALVESTASVTPAEATALRAAALDLLEAAEAVTPTPMDEFATDLDLVPLRDEPRFLELLASRPR